MATLLVTSAGGHLRQMWTLAPRLEVPRPLVWACESTAQSESLLGDELRFSLPPTPSRDAVGAVRVWRQMGQLLESQSIDTVVSTGALPAVPTFMRARGRGIPCHYIESAARSTGPSMTGRLVARIPGVRLYTQYPGWADQRWLFGGSVFDGFGEGPTLPDASVKRVVVTVGVERFDFARALLKVASIVPPDAEVLWQTGHSSVEHLGVGTRPWVPAKELSSAIQAADVIVAHAGVGAALTALAEGRCPVLLPRERSHGEHVDDHQVQIARELDRRGLAIHRAVDDLTAEDLLVAASRTVVSGPQPRFELR